MDIWLCCWIMLGIMRIAPECVSAIPECAQTCEDSTQVYEGGVRICKDRYPKV